MAAASENQAMLPPSHQDVVEDLKTLRVKGAARARGLHLPALRQAAVLLDRCDQGDDEPAPLLDVLREAADSLGGGREQEAVEYLLGLAGGAGTWESGARRQRAAALFNIQAETFRKRPERDLLAALAEGVLALCHDARLRRARLEMEQRRHPADSRLAVQWVERFEAYYRIWTPIFALAADLEAALDTYGEGPADRAPWQTEDEANELRASGVDTRYEPIAQARGYGRSALYWYTAYGLELKRFKSKHGGLCHPIL